MKEKKAQGPPRRDVHDLGTENAHEPEDPGSRGALPGQSPSRKLDQHDRTHPPGAGGCGPSRRRAPGFPERCPGRRGVEPNRCQGDGRGQRLRRLHTGRHQYPQTPRELRLRHHPPGESCRSEETQRICGDLVSVGDVRKQFFLYVDHQETGTFFSQTSQFFAHTISPFRISSIIVQYERYLQGLFTRVGRENRRGLA